MRIALGLVLVVGLVLGGLWVVGVGTFGEDWDGGEPTAATIPAAAVGARAGVQRATARLAGVAEPKQILFGDLHVHSTFSTDAFLMSLPLSGGDGARPVSDACDFARFCSALDFWSINDHALALTPRRWEETVDAVRQCNAVAGDAANPDVVAYLGWEWTQIGATPAEHWGHKNVVLRDLEDGKIPARPVAAGLPGGVDLDAVPSSLAFGLLGVLGSPSGGIDLVRYLREMLDTPDCPEGPVRDVPDDCIVRAPTPGDLFRKLDEWGSESIVIPHGTTWGYYTPLGSTWDKQLTRAQHDPKRQTLIEVFSGHGNSEELRSWREVLFAADGSASCPEPTAEYLPSCWRAGELIRERCTDEGESAELCDTRAVTARQNYVDAGQGGHHSVPAADAADWLDAGQCRDCFLPAFNYRPGGAAQYILALTGFEQPSDPLRFRLGFMASSDNHSARPGTGYKEYLRSEMTELRFAAFSDSVLANTPKQDWSAESVPFAATDDATQFFGVLETERQASFFLTGGLVAAHATGRDRGSVWDALQRREVYGTSGPRILLWFDYVDPATGDRLPMGSAIESRVAPTFQVRAAGSFEQKPGCPDFASEALGADGLQRLCGGECYHPTETRRPITRIEVVRVRPQATPGEPIEQLVEDPWKVLPCAPDLAGCRVTFTDPDYPAAARDTVYYVRAIEAPTPTVDHDGIACQDTPWDDDCLGDREPRAWSSPIFVDYPARSQAAAVSPAPAIASAR